MSTLWQELLGDLQKTASDTKQMKDKLNELDLGQLERIAAEIDALGNMNPEDLARMAQVMPVYSAALTQTEHVEGRTDAGYDDEHCDPVVDETRDMTVASEDDEDSEKLADDEEDKEDKEKEDSDESDKKDDKSDKSDKEDAKEEKDDKEATEGDGDMDVSAAETLYEILKQGAMIEELIETRAEEKAAELVEAMVKEAEAFDTVRAVAETLAVRMGKIGAAGHEFAMRFIEQVKTLAARTGEGLDSVAHALAEKVSVTGAGGAGAATGVATAGAVAAVSHMPHTQMGEAGFGGRIDSHQGTPHERYTENMNSGIGTGKMASEDDITMEDVAKYAEYLRIEQEKLASFGMEAVENMLVQTGQSAGHMGTKLFEFVQRAKEDIRTLAAKLNVSVVEAANRYPLLARGGAAGTGAMAGYSAVNAMSGSDRMVPSAAMAGYTTPPAINSNMTQDPDQVFHQMALQGTMNSPIPGTVDPGLTKGASDNLRDLIKRALADKPRS